ncbi:glycosyl hydrolase family 28-related protein [Sphingomonas sp.]|jgi:hypothetical protein|uniref:glycosyl hydrolase family 28-related protein n=1 Tax=Sphingomonas sp. TaxID=28214 RepID=UPI0035655992
MADKKVTELAVVTELTGLETLYVVQGGVDKQVSMSLVRSGLTTTAISEGSNQYFTDERAQDAVGAALVNTDSVTLAYDDATPSITAAVAVQQSITAPAGGIKLSGDETSPSASKYYGTDDVGTKGFHALPTTTLASIAALRLLTGAAAGQTADVTSYYAVDTPDGGGGAFKWSAESTATDDAGTIIKPTAVSGAGRWLRIWSGAVNVRWFGAKGDGTTDDTTAVHAAIATVVASPGFGGKVVFPTGNFRVTSGYTHTSAKVDVVLEGEVCGRENDTGQGSQVTLDNADIASFFYDTGTVNQFLQVRNITFKCAQSVPGRDFFVFRSNHKASFNLVNFENVERPFVFKVGSYFQNNDYTNIQFRGTSGTFHSETSTLIGTLMYLNNVNHESGCPNNTTEKVVCDLRGIRLIQATNFLLEGALPSSGWTILRLNGGGGTWEREFAFESNGYHSEWSGANVPTYALDMENCRAVFSQGTMGASASSPMKLSNSTLTLIGSSFTGDSTEIADYFSLDASQSRVILRDCAVRQLSGVGAAEPRITFENCGNNRSGGAGDAGLVSTILSNTQSTLMWRWNGGFSDPKVGTVSASGSTSVIPSLDASYGRKWVVTPNGQVVTFQATTQARGFLKQGDMFWITGHVTFPTFTSGTFILYFVEAGATSGAAAGFTTDYSAQTLRFAFPIRITAALTDTSTVGLYLTLLSGAGVSGTLDVHSIGLYSGNSAPQGEFPAYPATIITYNSAAPTVGEWAQGDIVYNNAPAASGTIGWVCTTAGTPGTWKTFGAISA